MLKEKINQLLSWRFFETTILTLIVINSVTLALETNPAVMEAVGGWLLLADSILLSIFVVEILLRLMHDFRGFWRDPWRIFDFFVVVIALMPTSGALSILRAFRILRVLRLVSAVPAMRRVVTGLLGAMPGMASIVFLIGLIFFVFSVISTKLFGPSFPEWFGTLGASAYTLFQVMTLESWSMGIVRPVMDIYPWAWLLFIPFIILTAFTVLNLFIGVIVDAMQSEHESNASVERGQMITDNEKILAELKRLRQEIEVLSTKHRDG